MDPFVAEIRVFGFNFAPKGWAQCDGQLLPISQNTALFSLLGTMYGGDGKSTFALPDLRGRAAMFHGQGPGLSLYDQGQTGGTETVTLLESEIPVHQHSLRAAPDPADVAVPNANAALAPSDGGKAYDSGTPDVQLASAAIAPVGGAQPHNNLMPSMTFTFCIALQGVFPPRG
jgi:microcystin-dependent protein